MGGKQRKPKTYRAIWKGTLQKRMSLSHSSEQRHLPVAEVYSSSCQLSNYCSLYFSCILSHRLNRIQASCSVNLWLARWPIWISLCRNTHRGVFSSPVQNNLFCPEKNKYHFLPCGRNAARSATVSLHYSWHDWSLFIARGESQGLVLRVCIIEWPDLQIRTQLPLVQISFLSGTY